MSLHLTLCRREAGIALRGSGAAALRVALAIAREISIIIRFLNNQYQLPSDLNSFLETCWRSFGEASWWSFLWYRPIASRIHCLGVTFCHKSILRFWGILMDFGGGLVTSWWSKKFWTFHFHSEYAFLNRSQDSACKNANIFCLTPSERKVTAF